MTEEAFPLFKLILGMLARNRNVIGDDVILLDWPILMMLFPG
jgi:hypothetical protein